MRRIKSKRTFIQLTKDGELIHYCFSPKTEKDGVAVTEKIEGIDVHYDISRDQAAREIRELKAKSKRWKIYVYRSCEFTRKEDKQ